MVNQHTTKGDAERAVYRAVPSSYIAMSLIWWISLGVVTYLSFKDPSGQDAWTMVALMAFLAVLSSAWLAAFRLEIGDSWIKYRSLFGGERTIRDSDVVSADSPRGANRFVETHLPPFRIEIVARSGTIERRTVINLKVFSRDAVSHLHKRLAPFLAK
ncbi:MAG TPA: hypothetical protein VGO52_23980 [Hyphomonadaceae bacterium]|jgi:hypothetical protein|nr:hypothetical protein [Hyphomonadaceae bacterium]